MPVVSRSISRRTEQRFNQSGLSLSLSNPVMDSAQGIKGQIDAAGNTDSPRMQALAAANTALAVKDIQQQITNGNATDLSLNISLGSSQSRSNSKASSNTARGSTLTAGGNLAIHALGLREGKGEGEGNITVQGSQLDAGDTLQLNAAEDIHLLASVDGVSQHDSHNSSSGSIGLGIGTNGLTLNLDASRAKCHGNGDSTFFNNTQVSAGNQVILTSGGDTALKGAVVSAPNIATNIGGDLTIESLQDTSVHNERHASSGVGASIPLGGKPTVSLDLSRTKVDSDFQSVNEQSGLRAGDGGFQINVGGRTQLNGGVITSTQTAIDDDRNTFTTAGQSASEALKSGALTLSDIGNRASYEAESLNISLSSGGSGTGLSGIGQDDGDASSTATAAISGLAGHQDARTGDAESGLAPIFDADNVRKDVQAQATITQEFGSKASELVGNIAQTKVEEAQLKRLQADAAQAAGDNERAAQLNAQADQLFADWGENGTKRLAAHTAIGALTGGTGGATGAAVGTLSAPAVASALKNAGLDDALTDGLTALVSTAAGAATGGSQGGAAAFNEVVNNYLTHPEAQRLQEIDRLLERDEQALSDGQRHALEEERIAILQLDQARDDALETACGQGGTAAACSYERALLDAAYSSWEAGDVDRDTYSDYQKTATLWADNQQQRMEHIGAEALTEMVVDSATAPLILAQLAGQAALGDEESRAILREMGNEIKAFAANPAEHISENNREQLAQADALEQAGRRDEADRLRMRVALENQTMVMGAGGLAASLPKVASSIVSRPGRAGDGGGVTQDAPNPGARPSATDAEAGGASIMSRPEGAAPVGDGVPTGTMHNSFIANGLPVSTAINDSVRLVDQASLPRGIRSTFLDGQYATVETTAPVRLFRKFGGTGNQAKANGGFATTVENASRSETAVFQQWSNQRFEAQLDIPENSVLNIGKVAPQTSRSGNSIYHKGEADQILLPQDYPTNWITSIRDGKTGVTYTVDEFHALFPDQFK